jgi:adenine-specific DNA-methyltransferase
LFKLLSPEHLLKLPFTNDSNSLDKRFYSELLHIIGLTEIKQGGKKIIERHPEGQRHSGSILEDAIIQLDSLDKISRLDQPIQYGNTHQERLFNVGLQLAITWINRILFLKLLEAQLITYHKGDKSYAFLNLEKIKNYDDLNSLFFQVLAKRFEDRNSDVAQIFEKVPYLNSSLFEPTDMEHNTLFISNLKDEKTIPILSSTVLKNEQGKKRSGQLSTLEYLFEFLNAYDFSSEGSEDIQEDNKTLINASVLGLIFEKINGYKDGSFFTPGFITMYMCRETIRKAVVQKFNETKNWSYQNLEDLYDKIEDRNEANAIVNSVKICDPAVGSGHFLVSALNEMIAVKNDLKILQDRNGKRLKEYFVEVVNDELIVTDEDGLLFEYNPTNKESQRIQETLFHEKQTIIENCLFGVDINPNSVKICRLRLWIELLKNAYYKNASELETLPNIDINIKCGNSLISRFDIKADITQALKKSKWTIDSYRVAVSEYRNAQSKEQKREMERLIADIKSDFRSEISQNDPKVKKLQKLSGELFMLTNQQQLFEMDKREKTAWNKKVNALTQETKKLENEIDEIKNNKIFENAFEWRFEFPEVLDQDGNFVGFDVVIGNPPYIGGRDWQISESLYHYYLIKYSVAEYQFDAYVLFWQQSLELTNNLCCLITPNTWFNNQKNLKLREYILNYSILSIADYSDVKVFEDATVLPVITLIDKTKSSEVCRIYKPHQDDPNKLFVYSEIEPKIWFEDELKVINVNLSQNDLLLRKKIEFNTSPLEQFANIKFGIKIYETGRGIPPQKKTDSSEKIFEADYQVDSSYRKYLEGKDVGTYQLIWRDRWLKYGLNLAAPRDPELFEGTRILVRRIVGERLIATLTETDYVTSQLLQIVKPYDESNGKWLLAILNSRLIAYYFRKKYNRLDKTFPEIRLYELASLPIKQVSSNDSLSEKVTQILTAKKQSPTADTSALESQIDALVYELYGLSQEEIKIIENN